MCFQRDVANDEADVMLSGKLFHEIGPADENDRPPSHQQRRGVMGRTLEDRQPVHWTGDELRTASRRILTRRECRAPPRGLSRRGLFHSCNSNNNLTQL